MMMKKTLITSFVASALMLVSNAALADVKEGTVLSAQNIDALYEDTFEGHKIKDLLTVSAFESC